MIVFLLLSSSFEPLPREGTMEEVHKQVGMIVMACSMPSGC